MNPEVKTCQNCKKEFVVEPEDFIFYEKIKVPPPTWCPECRMIRRFIWRNEHELFKRKDSLTGKDIFSGIPPQSEVKVYENTYWWSDAFDAAQYGRDYDFTRPFFLQFKELLYDVPWSSKSDLRSINSEYSDQSSDFKNCYLCFNGDQNEDCAYMTRTRYCKDCFDIRECSHNELCYDSVFTDKSYRVYFSVDIDSSTDIWFSKNLIGCSNCFGCVNLRKKSCCIYNEQYSPEEYAKKITEFNLGSHANREMFQKQARAYWLQFPVKFMRGLRNVGSTGERLLDTHNAVNCYCTQKAENVKYCQDIYMANSTECYDYSVWGGASLMYESMTCGEQTNMLRFCYDSWPSSNDLTYCTHCRSSSDLFGCVGLKKKQYCILNKQYTKEEYEALMPRIIQHMNEMPYIDSRNRVYKFGEFFPIEFSPFAYNETALNDLVPKTREEAEQQGFIWREPDAREFNTTIDAASLPDNILDVPETIVKEVIPCATCKRAFRIIPTELKFLKDAGLPLPRNCHRCRLADRQQFVSPPKFYHRRCMKAGCPNEFETAYAPDKPDIIYCESCYQAEVV